MRLLLEQQPGIEIVGEAVDTTGLLDWIKVVSPDVLLFDWELPGLPATALLPLLGFRCPDMRVIALSGRPEARPEALEAGVDLFVSKGDPPEKLLAALRTCREKRNGSKPRGERR